MIAIVGGLGAALAFAAATLLNARTSRIIGASSLLAWIMVVGLVALAPALLIGGAPDVDGPALRWLALAGLGNVAGLGLAYSGLRVGKVGIVAPIISTQGAIAALIAVAGGERIAAGVAVALAVIVAGVLLAGLTFERGGAPGAPLALAGAGAFGASLYATGRASAELPVEWALLPARALGVAVVFVPLAVTARLRLTRPAAPLVVASGLCEVGAFGLFALGSRHGIAVTAVLAAHFGAVAALAAYVLFGERLARSQVAGVALVVAGVTALTLLQA